MKRLIIYIIAIFSLCTAGYGQLSKKCASPPINWEALRLVDERAHLQQPLYVNHVVKVYFHICRNTDQTNAAILQTRFVDTEFVRLVADYAVAGICFANMGFDYIDNTSINTALHADNPAEVAWLNSYLQPNSINIFFHADLPGYGGNAYSIPNTFCSVDRGNVNDAKRTISHEVGHCLGLIHTHETANGIENINGSNCTSAGDLLCDTPADPYGRACSSTNGCSYTGTCTDQNGASNYSPPYSNIMSYWGDKGCVINNFTSGQYGRVTLFLAAYPPLTQTLAPYNLAHGPISISSGADRQAAINDFTTNGSVVITGSAQAMYQGRRLRLLPGFRASPISGKVVVRPTICSY